MEDKSTYRQQPSLDFVSNLNTGSIW